jgi:hypothetical protein
MECHPNALGRVENCGSVAIISAVQQWVDRGDVADGFGGSKLSNRPQRRYARASSKNGNAAWGEIAEALAPTFETLAEKE